MIEGRLDACIGGDEVIPRNVACPVFGDSGRSLHDRYRPASRPKNWID